MLQRYWRTATLAAFLFALRLLMDAAMDDSVQILFSMLFLLMGGAMTLEAALKKPERASGRRNEVGVNDLCWIESECLTRAAQWWFAAAIFNSFVCANLGCALWMFPLMVMLEERQNRVFASYPHWRESYARWAEQRQPYYVPPKTRMDGTTTCELDDMVDAR